MKRLRVERGLSQEVLAVDAGVARGYLGRMERGTENPTVDVLDRLAAALSVPAAALLRVPDEGETQPISLPNGRRPLR